MLLELVQRKTITIPGPTPLPFTINASEETEMGTALSVVRDSTISVLIDIGSAQLSFGIQQSVANRSLRVGQKIQVRNTTPNPDVELDFTVSSIFPTQNASNQDVQVLLL